MTKITKSSDILKIRNSRGLNNKRGVFTPCPLNSKEEESSVNGEQVILNSEIRPLNFSRTNNFFNPVFYKGWLTGTSHFVTMMRARATYDANQNIIHEPCTT